MPALRFTAIIKIRGINPYVLVSQARASQLKKDWRKPMPVLVRVNGAPVQPWHINMMPTGDGSFYLYLHGDVRKASATKVDDRVNIELDFDTQYKNGPMHAMPDQFAEALEQNPAAKYNWSKLSPSRQKEVLRYFASLKSDEARQRNLNRAINALTGEPARFMGRSWDDGS